MAHDSPNPASPLTLAIIGCGWRGRTFAAWAKQHPDQARVVAVADPIQSRRDLIGDDHAVSADMRFDGWESLMQKPRLADAHQHDDGSASRRLGLAAMALGYDMLLEKPMAVTLVDCIAIDESRRGNHASSVSAIRFAIIRATASQGAVDAGTVGGVISIDQLEGVDPQHQSHSFVRGNWGNESRSTFMLMAKGCHDIDVISYLVGRDVQKVSSFGQLSHFNRAQTPLLADPVHRWLPGCRQLPVRCRQAVSRWRPLRPIPRLQTLTPEQRIEFLRTSNYGRCVYDVDNDAVDHQVVAIEFDGGATGTFTMTAFAPGGRQLRLHGTHGYIGAEIDNNKILLHRFWGQTSATRPADDPGPTFEQTFGKPELIEVPSESGPHGGGDGNVMQCLVQAIRTNNPTRGADRHG